LADTDIIATNITDGGYGQILPCTRLYSLFVIIIIIIL